jgi:porin
MTKKRTLAGSPLSYLAFLSAAFVAHSSSGSTTSSESESSFDKPFHWVNSVINDSTKDSGITPSLIYEATILGNPIGGVKHGAAYAHNLEISLKFDLEKIANISGASFTVSGMNAAGRNLSSANYVNNAFPVSEAYIGSGTYLYQVYWQQKLELADTVIRLGRINSSNFASLPAFGLQVNGGIDGNPDSLFVNTNFQSMPNAVWGTDISINPSSEFNIYTGIFQATNFPGNQSGTDFSFRSSDRILWMGQVGWQPTFGQSANGSHPGYSGNYIIGFYYSNLPQQRFNGSGSITNSAGLYVMAQQTIWYNKNNHAETFDLWGGFTYSPQSQIAQIDWMGFGGFVWTGLLPGRNEDQFLGTVLFGNFSNPYASSVATPQGGRPSYEMVIEFSYIYNINSYAFIQPDIQYIIRPNGLKSAKDAVVIGTQFGITF